MKYVPPSVQETAFNCPHCNALAMQSWYLMGVRGVPGGKRPPVTTCLDRSQADSKGDKHSEWANLMATGNPFIRPSDASGFFNSDLWNVWLSKCFNCKKLSVWVYNELVHPRRTGSAPPANPDLSEDIRRDYDEASSILDRSPRGAAALIRFAIQKLCKELGQPGESLYENIKALVKAGLDPSTQKALDAVRVIGNNAVHPGQMDLRDDHATAESLFRLLNVIAEKMVSVPKHIDEIYEKLPEGARKEIEKRDVRVKKDQDR